VLPASYRRISTATRSLSARGAFKVITGGGHALDQVMLYGVRRRQAVLSADQC